MSKFYIGQKIVAIKDHSQGVFKKGDEFTVLAIEKTCCNFRVYIGINKEHSGQNCRSCGCIMKPIGSSLYFSENSFAPIELSTTTFEDVIKQNKPCLN